MASKNKKTLADTLKGDASMDEVVLEGTNVGEIFQKAREKEGLTLSMVSKELMIRKFYLSALEEGRYHELPSNVYAVGFVKSYSDYLGLETGKLVEQFRRERGGATQKTELVFPEMVVESKVPNTGIILGGIAAAIVVLFLIASIWGEDKANELETVPEPTDISITAPKKVPDLASIVKNNEEQSTQAQAMLPSEETADIVPPTEDVMNMPAVQDVAAAEEVQPINAAGEEVVATPETEKPMPSATIQAKLPSEETTVKAVVPAPQPQVITAEPVVSKQESLNETPQKDSRITVAANSEAWVEIRDRNGVLLLTRVLQPGQRYDVPDEKGITMITGNAGGIFLIVDGKELPPLGNPASVKRNIKLDADLY